MDTPQTPDTGQATDASKSIVIVDDDEDTADLCAYVLRELGNYQVVVERDSTRALQVIRLAQPDMVLTDVQMPRVDGLRLRELLQQDTSTQHIPVLLMTGKISISQFESLGITRWVEKPFAVPDLLDAVNAVFDASAA